MILLMWGTLKGLDQPLRPMESPPPPVEDCVLPLRRVCRVEQRSWIPQDDGTSLVGELNQNPRRQCSSSSPLSYAQFLVSLREKGAVRYR